MMFQFLLSMLLALHTFPCFLSPFVWNWEKSHSSQIVGFTEPSAGSAAPSCPDLCPAQALPGSREHSRAAVRLGCLEMQLELDGIPEQHREAALGAPGDLKGLFQPRKSWHSVLVHRDTLTWGRESRNFTVSWGELIPVWEPKIPHE